MERYAAEDVTLLEELTGAAEAACDDPVERVPPIDPESLADLVFTTFEGGFILARTMDDPGLLRVQLAHVRRYVGLLFDVQPRARTRTSEISVALPSGTSTIHTTT